MNKLSKVLSILTFSLCLTACGGEVRHFYENHILNINDLDGAGDHEDSPYYVYHDYYNMGSEGSRVLLSHFRAYEQQESYTCGPSSVLMVLTYFGFNEDGKYTELSIAKGCGAKAGIGSNQTQLGDWLKSEGYSVKVNAKYEKKFLVIDDFHDFCYENLNKGLPIIVDWEYGSGHWMVIIGYDDMGTDTFNDDVVIFADSSDAYDHYQDGYDTFPAKRFFSLWHEGKGSGEDGKAFVQPYVIIENKAPTK